MEFDINSDTNFNTNFNTDLLGLKYTLVDALTEAGFNYFEDFLEVEVDMGNAELKVKLVMGYTLELKEICKQFVKEHKFKHHFFSEEKHAIYFRM